MVIEAPTHFIRAKELSQRWGVHRSTIWRWARQGRLPRPKRFSKGVAAWPMAVVWEFERQDTEGAGTACNRSERSDNH